jgi:hypothetical protein
MAPAGGKTANFMPRILDRTRRDSAGRRRTLSQGKELRINGERKWPEAYPDAADREAAEYRVRFSTGQAPDMPVTKFGANGWSYAILELQGQSTRPASKP